MTILSSVPAVKSFLDTFPLSAGGISVAQENFTASQPPIRSLNVTQEIFGMLRRQKVTDAVQRLFEKEQELI